MGGSGCCVGDCCVEDRPLAHFYCVVDNPSLVDNSRQINSAIKTKTPEEKLAENEFYDRMILKMILTAKNNLDESINNERRQIAVLEKNLMRNIFRRGVLQLLSDFLNTEKLT